jgi:predicted nucleic acid-binding protein
MPDDTPRTYWDACVLLSYINGIPERVPTIDELLRQSRAGDIELLTSAISQVEVAFAASEKDQQILDPHVEQAIVGLWAPGAPIKAVEFYELIADRARSLMRQGISQGWGSLKPADAIHIATAQQLGVGEFHTYDSHLLGWSGTAGFPIVEPHTAQGLLGTG